MKGAQVSGANYSTAIDQLKIRYGREEEHLQILLHRFHSIPSTCHNLVELRSFKTQSVQLQAQVSSLAIISSAELIIKNILA